jgi:hypothetical protein
MKKVTVTAIVLGVIAAVGVAIRVRHITKNRSGNYGGN